MKNKIGVFYHLLIMIFFIGCMQFAVAQTTLVSVSPSVKYQTMKGYGVSLCWWADIVGGMSQPNIDSITKLAASDLNLNIFRFNIGGGENPNCTSGHHMRKDGGEMPGYRSQFPDQQGWGTCNLNNDKRQIAVMDKLASYRPDVITEIFSNSPPWWMTNSLCTAGSVDGSENINPAFVDDFADYLATVTSALNKRNPAWNLKHIEPFNEPLSTWWTKGGSQEGCNISPATQATTLWRLWNSKNTYGISSLGITASDCNSVPEAISNATYLKTNNLSEYNGLAHLSTHTYFGTSAEKKALCTYAKNNGNKEVWQTESGPISWQPADGVSWWSRHYMMSNRLIDDLRNLQCPVWCDWQFMSTDDGWGMLELSNFNAASPYQTPVLKKTRGFYCRKNITNFLKAGYRIIASSDDNTLAGLNPDSTELVFVISNMDSAPKRYDIDLSKFKNLGCFKTYRTSGDDNSVENCSEKIISTLNEKGVLSGSKLSYSAKGYSVTTFVISLKPCASCITVKTATSFCAGDSVVLTSSPGISYKWFNGTSQVGTSSTLAAKISGSYTVEIVQSNGCKSTSAAQIVNVNPLPALISYYNINSKGWQGGNALQVCKGDNVYTGPWPTVDPGWSWTGPGNFTSTLRSPVIAVININQGGIYTATYKDGNGCSSSLDLNVTVSVPTALITSPSARFCPGGNVTLTASTGTSYVWRDGATTVGTSSTYIAKTAGKYTVIVSDANSCKDTSLVKTITISPVPVISITSPANNAVVTNDTFPINTSVTGTKISSVKFYNGTSLMGTVISSPYNFTTPSFINGTYNFTTIAKNTFNCADTANVTVKVNKVIAGFEDVTNENDNFYVSPNPFTDHTLLNYKGTFEYTILDLKGQELEKRTATNSATIGSGLSTGAYFIRVSNGEKSQMFKVVKH